MNVDVDLRTRCADALAAWQAAVHRAMHGPSVSRLSEEASAEDWVHSSAVSSLLRQRNQFVNMGSYGPKDASEVASLFTWNNGGDVSSRVQQWRRDELAESVAPVWFHRADMEMLLAYVVFSSSAESAALVFVHEESQWKYHNAVIVDSSKIAEWSDSIDTAEQRFSAGQMFQRSSSFVRSGSINSVGSDAQDYWQLYDMELPRDPSEEAERNRAAKQKPTTALSPATVPVDVERQTEQALESVISLSQAGGLDVMSIRRILRRLADKY